MLTPNAIHFLGTLGVTEATATAAQISDAISYSTCYDWYINNQEVLPENATIASTVWVNKYALHNSDGICLERTPEDMWDRIANTLADEELLSNPSTTKTKEEWFAEFRDILTDWKYTPAGSGLFALGNDYANASVSNCYVYDGAVNGDSLEGIFETAKDISTIYKNRGGVGLDISYLRPAGSRVSNAAKTSSGAVSFMNFFSDVTAIVGQNARRGALMLSMRVDHIDIEAFIDEKLNLDKKWFFNELLDAGINIHGMGYSDIFRRLGSTSSANISVKLTQKFMDAVESDGDFELWYEFEDNKYPRVSKLVKARSIWNKLIASAHSTGDPGLLHWDNIIRESITDCYSSKTQHNVDLGNGIESVYYDAKTVSTNPCVTGDTLVAVADGRGFVSIKDLAEQQMDVEVFCSDSAGRIKINTMRNPRITGYNEPILKLTLENGHVIRCTKNHKLMTSSGSYAKACDLSIGDGLAAFYKKEATMKEVFPEANSNSSKYIYLQSPFCKSLVSEHRSIYEFYSKKPIPTGYVIHHVDYNSRNNSISNLRLMSRDDHTHLHSDGMLGLNNPVFKVMADPEKNAKWRSRLSESCAGSKNGRCYSNVSNTDLYDHALSLTRSLGRRFSTEDWESYAKLNGLPMTFTKYRAKDLGSVYELSLQVAKQLNIPYYDTETRLQATYKALVDRGERVFIDGGKIYITRTCEHCGNSFVREYLYHEVAFCSFKCSTSHMHSDSEYSKLLANKISLAWADKVSKYRVEQARVALDLNTELGRPPLKKEWEDRCRSLKIPFRLKGSDAGFQNYAEVIEASKNLNHKIISIEFDGYENVYNGTVDNLHNFFIGCFEESEVGKSSKWLLINNLQCGELPLAHGNACCLGSFYLPAFIINPWSQDARFDYDKFSSTVKLGTRAQDNIKGIDIRKAPLAINKIASVLLRTLGLGCHGLYDALAALGLRYDSDEAIRVAYKIYETLKNCAFSASVQLGREKGNAPIWDWKLESGNPFLARLEPSILDSIKTYGRRNISILTSAPAGSISILSRNCSSSFEPAFRLEYKRNVKVSSESTQYIVRHQALQDCIDHMGNSEVFIESNDVNPYQKIKMQAALQTHIDNSISNTLNLPGGSSVSLVDDLYKTAFRSGLKGFTVFVDGCKEGVLSSSNELSNSSPHRSRPILSRPKTTDVDIMKTRYKDKTYMILVGKMPDGTPIECFGGVEDGVSLPSKYEKATLTKKSRGHYTLTIQLSDDPDDIMRINNVANRFPAADIISLTRMITLALKNRVPIGDIVEQLAKSASEGSHDASYAFARVLKQYIPDEELVAKERSKGEVCPDCGGELDYRRESGCMTKQCKSCAYFSSKCG